MCKRALAPLVACLVLTATALEAQQNKQVLLVLPGADTNGTNITTLAVNPFSPITSLAAGAGSFLLFAKPDNSRFYIVATSLSQTVTSVDNTFQAPRTILALSQPALAGAMSPDGTRLAVVDGNSVHIIDTTSDTDLVPNGITVGAGFNVFDVASSLDGTKFYTLATSANGSQLNAIDVASNTVTSTLAIQGTATALAVGPNGLIYVSTQNLIVEVSPVTFKATLGGSVQVNAKPGRLVFTTDGQYALAPNQTPVTGSAVLLISLGNHALVNTVPNFGILIDSLQVMGTTQILGYSSQNQSAYQFTISNKGGIGVSAFNVPGTSNQTTALTVSNEVPGGGLTFVQSVYAVNSDVVYQIDPANSQTKGQTPLPTGSLAGAIAYAAPAVTAGTPTTLLQYGNEQTVATSSTSNPIVVQVLDPNNHPMSGVSVAFATTSTTATLSAKSVTTQSNGYALVYLNSGKVTGPVQVTATAGAKNVGFTINVGVSTGGTVGGLVIVSGQGQILPGGDSTQETGTPLVVKVTDANGVPVPGAAVTFTVSQGQGNLFSNLGGAATAVVDSDANGLASIDFLSPEVLDPVNQFLQTQITASAHGTNSITFYVTAVVQQNNGAELNSRQTQPAPGAVLAGQAGATLTGALQILVASATSVPIPNVAVVLNDGGVDPTLFPSAKCNDPNGTGVLSNSAGLITCDIVLGPVVGTVNVKAVVGIQRTEPPFSINVSPGPPGVVKIVQGNNQSGSPGQKLPASLKVQVTDSAGNILPGTSVSWQVVTPGTVTLSNVITITDSTGYASATATLGNIAGNAQVTVTAGHASATFSMSVVVPSSGIVYVSGNNQTTQTNTAFGAPLVVQVVDANNNGVPGILVSFQVTGPATLSSSSATTDASGNATVTATAGATAGAVTVTASANGFNFVFSLTVILPGPTNLAIVNWASFDRNTGISPGGIAVLTGNCILSGVQGLLVANNILGPLPTIWGGASVAFGPNLVLAPIYYVMNTNGQDQIAVQVPFEIQPGPITITVNAAGGGSAPLNVNVQPYAPGVFTTSSGGQLFAVAVRPDGSFVSPANPAMRGEDITIYVTGLGQVSPATGTGDIGVPGETQTVLATLVVGLNNGGVPLVSAVYAPGMIGVYAVTIHVPANTTPGPAQPIGLIAVDAQGNNHFGQAISIPIQ